MAEQSKSLRSGRSPLLTNIFSLIKWYRLRGLVFWHHYNIINLMMFLFETKFLKFPNVILIMYLGTKNNLGFFYIILHIFIYIFLTHIQQ